MWRNVAISVVLAGALTACGWGSGAGTTSVHTRTQSSTVLGQLMVYTTPLLGPGQYPAPPAAPNESFTLVAISRGGRMIVRSLVSDDKGRFRVVLPAGRYRIGTGATPKIAKSWVSKALVRIPPGQFHLRVADYLRQDRCRGTEPCLMTAPREGTPVAEGTHPRARRRGRHAP